MRKSLLVPLLGILALLLIVGSNAFKSSPAPVAPALPVITSDVQPMTVDELHARFRRSLGSEMSGHYSLAVDKDAHTIACDMWSDGFDAAAVNGALHARDLLQRWNTDTAKICGLCADMQEQVVNHGHDEYTVIMRLVNCDDLGQIFAVAERGVLVYDVVEDTPPGGVVPDPTKRLDATNTDTVYGDYVLNVYSRVFHSADCQYAPQLAAVYRSDFVGHRDELLAKGFFPCAYCQP